MQSVAFERCSSSAGDVGGASRVHRAVTPIPRMLPNLAIGLLLAGGIDLTFLSLARCAESRKRHRPEAAAAAADDELSDIEMDTFQPVTQSVCASKRKLRRFSRLRGVLGKGRRGRQRAKTEPEMEEELSPLPSAYKHYDW